MSKPLTAADLQALIKAPARVVKVDLPGNAHVFVRAMNAGERDSFESAIQTAGRNAARNFRARFMAVVLCDADGKRLFGDGDVETLAGMPCSHSEPICEAASKLNAVSESDIKDLEGNSAADPTGASSSD